MQDIIEFQKQQIAALQKINSEQAEEIRQLKARSIRVIDPAFLKPCKN